MILEHEIPIYGVGLFVGICATDKEVKKYFDAFKEPSFQGEFDRTGINTTHYSVNDRWIFIDLHWAGRKYQHRHYSQPGPCASISHEVFHAKNRVLEMIHDRPSRDYDEMEAYLIAWLTRTVYETINQYLKPKKIVRKIKKRRK